MAKTKTTPKVDGDATDQVSTSDAPAAIPADQETTSPREEGDAPIADKLVRLGGAAHESALKKFQETGKVPSGRTLRWKNGEPEFYRKG